MASERSRLVIPLGSNEMVRNFIDSGAFACLAEEHELVLLLSPTVTSPLPGWEARRVANTNTRARAKVRWLTFYVSMNRHAKRSSTFPTKYRRTFYQYLPPWRKLAVRLLSLPVAAECLNAAAEAYLGTVSGIDAALKDLRPDLLVLPCAFNDIFSLDCLKSAKGLGITNLMLMLNWDNVSSKGVLPFLPDYLSVWGEQTKRHAVQIHRLPAEKVFILGSPHFEVYKHPPAMARAEFRRVNNLPQDKNVILVVGMSRFTEELTQLQDLEAAIERGDLPNTHILYRPHPWREIRYNKRNFFDFGFRHITMDAQLTEHYKKLMSDTAYQQHKFKEFIPDYRYYPSLFNGIDAAITMGTTMGIEAMVSGKPILIKAFADANTFFWGHEVVLKYAHNDCWPAIPSVILAHEAGNFIADVRKLLALANQPDIARRVRREIQEVVFDDGRSYAERLAGAVRQIMPQKAVAV